MSVGKSWTVKNTAVQWSFTEHFGSPSPGQGDTAIRVFLKYEISFRIGRACLLVYFL